MSARPDAPTDENLAALDEAWRHIVHARETARALAERWAAGDRPASGFAAAFYEVIRGHALASLQDYPAAQACEARAVALLDAPDLAAGARPLLVARIATLEAALAFTRRDLDQALATLDRALLGADALPRFDRYYLRYLRGLAQVARGRYDLAFVDLLHDLDWIVEQHPGVAGPAQLNLGAVLVHVGDWHGAEESMREAARFAAWVETPGFATACRLNLAYILLQREDRAGATAALDEALRDARDWVIERWHAGDVLATCAETLVETGHLDEARDYLARLRAQAEQSGYLLGIGAADWADGLRQRRLGDLDGAMRTWAAALRRLRAAPQVPHRWKTMRAVADGYAARGDWRRAYRWQRRFHAAHARWEQGFVAARLVYARQRNELARTREQAMRDPTTGLLNRRGMFEHIAAAVGRAEARRLPLHLVMVDLDNLKPINDRWGHAVGDAAIGAAADALRTAFGEAASIFRYGGDEFLVVLADVPHAQAIEATERALAALREWRPADAGERRTVLTASAGLASHPADGTTAERLVDAADTALYKAKKSGGDRLASA